jgi:uncharacterized membrane protein
MADTQTKRPAKTVPAAVSQNIEALEEYYRQEERGVSAAQRLLERSSAAVGRPWFLALILTVVVIWILYNSLAPKLDWPQLDAPPFFALQGLVSLIALLVTTVVLIGQNRIAQREKKREEMELQVNILTEQKTTKLLHLIEELRRDLPMVRDRHDADAAELQQPTDAADILHALDQAQSADPKKDPAT